VTVAFSVRARSGNFRSLALSCHTRPAASILLGVMADQESPSKAGGSPAISLAALFLLPVSPRLHEGDGNWARAGRWLPLWGLATGILYVGVFGVTWRYFGEYHGIRWIPAAAVLAVDLGLLGYRLLSGSVRLVTGQTDEDHRSLALTLPAILPVVLVAILKFALLVSLRRGHWQSAPAGAWQWDSIFGHLGFLYPQPIYRPLVLMPLWGRWAMSLALSIGRPAPNASGRLKTMANRSSLPVIFGQWLLCALLTVVYCSGSGEHVARSIIIALNLLMVAYLASFALSRKENGQTESTVTAIGLVGELTFLALYASLSSAIYWY